jgi:hypothetical protein
LENVLIIALIRFFSEERHADQFLAGGLRMNTAAHYKAKESATEDGRGDPTEVTSILLQPKDVVINLSIPSIANITITEADLAGPISVSSVHHEDLRVYCMYAVHSEGFVVKDGDWSLDEALLDQVHSDFRFHPKLAGLGDFAVVVQPQGFFEKLLPSAKSRGLNVRGRLVNYYDRSSFSGEIPGDEVPFWKSNIFDYQREFRVCAGSLEQPGQVLTLDIGDLSAIGAKYHTADLLRGEVRIARNT